MKALIYNSGLGKRMGELTENNHKSMVRLSNGEAIYERQIRLLHECGINDFIVTVGPFKEQLMEASRAPHLADCNFTFVENPIYDKTNYIYSMYLARDYIDDDVITLHGDLVFNKRLLQDVLASDMKDVATANAALPQPEKDFKARIKDGKIQEVSVKIFDDDCIAFQPMYKLSHATIRAWLDRVSDYVAAGNTGVYAENAMNELFPELDVKMFSYDGYFIDEIDCAEDHARVSAAIRRFDFREQEVICGSSADEIKKHIEAWHAKKPMIVCDSAFGFLKASDAIRAAVGENAVWFDKVRPNPLYEDVVEGIKSFNENKCDYIVAVGGGSAIDTAKAIKLYSLDDSDEHLNCAHRFNAAPLLAVPTTAGTGSESTRFAVAYYNGAKQSITHDSIVPNCAVLDASLLVTLPDNQKKSTVLDALCQAIESMWSVNSDDESAEYAKKAIDLIRDNYESYLSGNADAAEKISVGANLAGKSINITQTTAAHAMSYKVTSLFGIPHGAAVALCMPAVWKFNEENISRCNDKRGESHLKNVFAMLKELIGGVDGFVNICKALNMPAAPACDAEKLETLVKSVNPVRLSNNPVTPTEDELKSMYTAILNC